MTLSFRNDFGCIYKAVKPRYCLPMSLVPQHGVKRRHEMDILAFIPLLLHLSSRLQKDISSLVLTTKSSSSLLSDCISLQLVLEVPSYLGAQHLTFLSVTPRPHWDFQPYCASSTRFQCSRSVHQEGWPFRRKC